MVKRGSKKDVKFSVEFSTDGLSSVMKTIEQTRKKAFRAIDELKTKFSKYEEPSCEIRQNHKRMKIEVKLPEVKKKDVLLNITQDKIEIKAEARTNTRKVLRTYHRIIDIPKCGLPKKTKANFKNGVLKLDLPYKL